MTSAAAGPAYEDVKIPDDGSRATETLDDEQSGGKE